MKFYKLDNATIQDARNKNPLECYYADGQTSFYVSESGETLKAPFIEVKKSQLPEEFINAMNLNLSRDKEYYFKLANEAVEQIQTFKSSILGEEYIYDFSREDQINLSQAIEYSRNLGDVGIRATRGSDGVKNNYLHTRQQVSALFDEWYAYKTKILNAFSEFKIEIKNAETRKAIQQCFSDFTNKIKD